MLDLSNIVPLQDELPLLPRETALSYVSRLAAYHGCRSAQHFCDDFDLGMAQILDGDQNALMRLSILSGADFDDLCRWSPKKLSILKKSINHEMVYGRSSPRRIWTLCPECARGDIAARSHLEPDIAIYGRAEWQVSFIRTCSEHSLRLVRVDLGRNKSARNDFANFVSSFLRDLDETENVTAVPGPMESYALRRILGVPQPTVPLLDDIELAQAVSVCTGLGASLLGNLGSISSLDSAAIEDCQSAGFIAIERGLESLLPAMATMRDRGWEDQPDHGCLARAARVFQNLPDTEAVARVRRAIAHAAFATFPFRAGESFLQEVCQRPSLYRYNEGRVAYGITRQIWDAFVAHGGIVAHRGQRPARTLIDIEKADAVFRNALPLISAGALSPILGLCSLDFSQMLAAGIVRPFQHAALADLPDVFSLPQVEERIGNFTKTLAHTRNPGAECISLSGISNTIGVEIRTVLELLGQGKLSQVEFGNSKFPLADIRANPREVLTVALNLQEPLNIHEVASQVGLHHGVVRILAGHGVLPAIKRKWRGGTKYVFEQRDVATFLTKFVATRGLSQYLPRSYRTRRALAEIGVRPAFVTDGSKSVLYLRSDLERVSVG